MATGAGLAEWEQTHGKKKAKCVLTSTGQLMEGLDRSICEFLVCLRVAGHSYGIDTKIRERLYDRTGFCFGQPFRDGLLSKLRPA
jgi:hypothetical protein